MSDTHTKDSGNKLLKRVLALVVSFGPGIFAIGYTIGTGSVTSMIVAGSELGMQLLWVLMLSCLFSGLLIFVYGNFTLITGDTALYSFKKNLKYGKLIAILIIIGVSFGQWNSLMGILGISANIIFEMFNLQFPDMTAHLYAYVLTIATVIISVITAFCSLGNICFLKRSS
ncbi:MAG: divalent metal cation transporter [Lutimonas sp.]